LHKRDRAQAAVAVKNFTGTFTTTVSHTAGLWAAVTVTVSTNVTIFTPMMSAIFYTQFLFCHQPSQHAGGKQQTNQLISQRVR